MAGDSVQFAIDIAASMTGGEYTASELDDLTAKLMGGGKGAEHFQLAVKQVAEQLTAAKAATSSANAALAEGTAQWSELAKAAARAQKEADAAMKKGAGNADEFAAAAMAAKEAVNAQAETLKGLEAAAKGARAEEDKLAGTLGNVRKLGAHVDKTFAGQAETYGKVQSSLGAFGGPMARLGGSVANPIKGFTELAGAIGKTKAIALLSIAAFAALAAIVAIVVAAVVAGAVAVGTWAVKLADSARNAALAREALAQVDPQLASLQEGFQALTDATGVGADKLTELAKSLRDAGVSADELPTALRAAATAEAALGQGGATDFVKRIKAGQESVGALAQDVDKKFGGIVARKMLSLDAQAAKLKSSFTGLFSGLKIDSVLSAFQTIVGMFDKTSVTGQALQFMFEAVFQPLIDNAQTAAYFLEAFFIGFEIGLVKMYLALKPAIKYVSELFGFEDMKLADTCAAITKAAQVLAFAFGAVVIAFTGVAAVVAVVVGAFVAINVAIGALAAAIIGGAVYALKLLADAAAYVGKLVVGSFAMIKDAIFGTTSEMGKMGEQMIAGLVGGITASAKAVVDAVSGVVSGGINAAKKVLGIASPSKVMRGIGVNTGEGYTVGVEKEQESAERAVEELVAPPAPTELQPPKMAPIEVPGVQAPKMAPIEAPAVLSPKVPAIEVPAIQPPKMAPIEAQVVQSVVSPPAADVGTAPKQIDAMAASSSVTNNSVTNNSVTNNSSTTNASKQDSKATAAGSTFNITINGVSGAEDLESRLRLLLSRIVEGDAMMVGA